MCEGTTQTALDGDVMNETKADPDNKDLRRKELLIYKRLCDYECVGLSIGTTKC